MNRNEETEIQIDDLLFGVRRSVRYHNRRRMFFDRLNTLSQALSVIFGSATMYAVLTDLGRGYAVTAAALVTAFSTINLVVGSTAMARLHHDLARRFIALEKSMVMVPRPGEADISSWTQARLDIEMDEPPPLRVLDSICHNELMQTMGYPRERWLRIGWFQRLVAQIFDFRERTVRKT